MAAAVQKHASQLEQHEGGRLCLTSHACGFQLRCVEGTHLGLLASLPEHCILHLCELQLQLMAWCVHRLQKLHSGSFRVSQARSFGMFAFWPQASNNF
jgi:hypothetical protein